MKTRSLLCLVVLLPSLALAGAAGDPAVSEKIEKAGTAYRAEIASALGNYRKAFGEAIAGATNVEVFLLDFETKPVKGAQSFAFWERDIPEDTFPIMPYGAASKILKRKKLSAEEVALLLPNLRATIGVEKDPGSAGCHFPIHGIRVRDGDEIIFQTSICYHCGNFYMQYPSGSASWTGLSEPKFREVMEKLMPIPQKEIDRFNAKWGDKKKVPKKK